MDLHILPGIKARDVAEAHRRDMLIQREHGCECMTYWIDEKRGNVFCLIEAPCEDAVKEMHNKAHGLIPHRIIEVNTTLVESFLGRISDPGETAASDDGLTIFSDPSFRILLVIKINDPVLLQYKLGKEKANELLSRHKHLVRKKLAVFGGSEAEHEGAGFIASFVSAGKAVSCALSIQKILSGTAPDNIGFRIGINAGEPVAKNDQLFGDTIQLAERMCTVAGNLQVAVSSVVKELVSKDHFQNNEHNILTLSPQDETLLGLLFNTLEENWQDADFNVTDYCHTMAMSKSQLYRKTVALSGFSPNVLLKEFRLEKAKELMKKQHYNISQITFDSGFTSPSYFTKCFKKKYGLLPMAYLDMLY
jgi:AraC-like DNA-binding protein